MKQSIPVVTKRSLIIDAFHTLLKSRPYRQIRVVDIIRSSGVSHQTFYRLFTDKNTLTKTICVEDFSLFFLIHGNTASWKEIVMDILTVVQRKGGFYRRLLADHTGADLVLEALQEVSSTYSGAPCSLATLSIWLCVLREWSKQHFRDSPVQAYRNLLYHLPVSDVLTGEELDRVIERYEQLGLGEYSKFRSWENLK